MPTIPAALLHQIKARRPLAALLAARGVTLHRQGADQVCCCPLPTHDDRTPSFHLTEDGAGQSVAHCFGCDWAGNVFQLIQVLDGCGFVEAVATAAQLVGVAFEAARYRPPPPRRAAVSPACPLDPAADEAALSAQVISYYHSRLLRAGGSCWAYLQKRGLADLGLIRRFQLGYAERGALGRLLPEKSREVGRELRQKLEKLDWFKAGSGHETFAGRFVVPILDADGLVQGCYGRALSALKNAPAHLYQRGPLRGLWNAAAFLPGGAAAQSRTVVLCEALLDALSLARYGVEAVTALCGAQGLSELHLSALRRAQVQDVILAYDADQAGEAAANAQLAPLVAQGHTVYRLQLPAGQDCNDLIVNAGEAAAEAVAKALRSVHWLGGARPLTVASPAAPPAAAAEIKEPIFESAQESSKASAIFPAAPAAPLTKKEAASHAPALPPGIEALEPGGPGQTLRLGNRRWRLLGLEQLRDLMAIKLGLRVSVGEASHQDQLDLSQHRARAAFVSAAAAEVPVQPALLHNDLKILLGYAEAQIDARQQELEAASAPPPNPLSQLSASERTEAEALLKAPDLCERIVADLASCGLVGERVNVLTAYLAATTRLLSRPLAVLVQSSSAAGKTTLMDAICQMMPPESTRRYSALSPKALYYLGAGELAGKILAVAEEEGAEAASYSLKLLQSDGSLVFACPMKQPDGSIRTEEVRIDGPIMLFLTTTRAGEGDAELENRCIKLSVDEDAAQTAAIHAQQRRAETWAGLEAQATAAARRRLHQNAQRLLRPLAVINPYALQLGFSTHQARLRRDHRKYLDLIKAVTFLHQYQRPHETRNIHGQEVDAVLTTAADIKLANELAHVVLGRSLDDLPPQARRLLGLLYDLVGPLAAAAGCGLSQHAMTAREMLPHLPYGLSQLRAHLAVLIAHDYVGAWRRHAAEAMQYRLLSDDRPDARSHHCLGLIDPDSLDQRTKPDLTNSTFDATPPDSKPRPPDENGRPPDFNATPPDRYRAVTGPLPGRYRIAESPIFAENNGHNGHNGQFLENEHKRALGNGAAAVMIVGDR